MQRLVVVALLSALLILAGCSQLPTTEVVSLKKLVLTSLSVH
jgi:uncharacterized lipoprotein YajG